MTITITGVNDGAVIAGDDHGAVTEDASTPTLSDSGTLTLTDLDVGQAVFKAGTGTPTGSVLGSLSITADGKWTYNVANGLVQYLKEGEIKVETFTVHSADGTEHTVTITINGTNDLPTLAISNGAVVSEELSLIHI